MKIADLNILANIHQYYAEYNITEEYNLNIIT